MRKTALLLATAAALAASPALATTTLTFDGSLASYAPLGITFDSNFGSTFTDTFGGAVVVPGAPNYATFNSMLGTISFATPTSTFGFTTVGLNAGGGFFDGARVTAFNAAGVEIGTQVITTAGPNEIRTPYTFAFAPVGGGISSVTFSRIINTAGSGIFGFDNLTFDATSAVPEPATWALMLAGFGMIGFAARRRSNVKTTVRFA